MPSQATESINIIEENQQVRLAPPAKVREMRQSNFKMAVADLQVA